MNVLLSFIGCIDVLMCGSGLEEILNVAFRGVSDMLSCKGLAKSCSCFMDGGRSSIGTLQKQGK